MKVLAFTAPRAPRIVEQSPIRAMDRSQGGADTGGMRKLLTLSTVLLAFLLGSTVGPVISLADGDSSVTTVETRGGTDQQFICGRGVLASQWSQVRTVTDGQAGPWSPAAHSRFRYSRSLSTSERRTLRCDESKHLRQTVARLRSKIRDLKSGHH